MGKLEKTQYCYLTEIRYYCNNVNMQTVIYEEIIKLQPRGVFTIPKRLREGLFDESGIARIKRLCRTLVIEPVRTLSYPVRSYTNKELKEFFELDEKETKNLKDKGLI